MEFSQAPGDLSSPQGPEKNSQDETNSLVKVKFKPELHFCGQTDDDISFQPGIINWSSTNCNLKSCPWVDALPGTLSQLGLQIGVTQDITVLFGCQSSSVVYVLLLSSTVSISLFF